MEVYAHDVAAGTVELEVRVDEDQFGKAVSLVIDEIAHSTQIPGFRKGKAPRSMVERSVNHDAVRARAIDRVLPDAYTTALGDSGLKPLAEPQVEILSSDQDKDLRFKIVVHKQPEVTPGPVRGLHLTRYITDITDEDVERDIQHILNGCASFIPVPDAVIGNGDMAVLDIEVRKGDEPLLDAGAVDLELIVGQYRLAPAVDDDLIGLKAGDVKDIDVTYPPDFHFDPLQGAEAVWHVTVKDVRRSEIPELTVELLQENLPDIPPVEDLDQFRAMLKDRLQAEAVQMDDYSLRNRALANLLETSTVVFPQLLLDQEMEGRLGRLERNLARNHRTFADFAAHEGATSEQMLAQMREQAELDMTEYLLIHRIAAEEQIEVSIEEIHAQIEKEGRDRGARDAIIEIEKQNDSRQSAIRYDILRDRVLSLVVENAIISEEHQTRPEAEAAEEDDNMSVMDEDE